MEGKVDQIEALLRQAVTKKQLVASGFSESTVRKAMKRLQKQGEALAHDPATSADSGVVNDHPATDEGYSRFPVKLSAKEIIPPEVILSGIRLQDGEYKLGFVDGQKTLMAAQWMVLQQVSMLQGLAAAQAETMESQLKILREVKSDSDEVAQRAAQEAAAGVAAYFEREKPWLAASPNPMASMMVELMKPILQNMIGRFMPGVPGGHVDQSGAGFSPPPGFSYKEEEK